MNLTIHRFKITPNDIFLKIYMEFLYNHYMTGWLAHFETTGCKEEWPTSRWILEFFHSYNSSPDYIDRFRKCALPHWAPSPPQTSLSTGSTPEISTNFPSWRVWPYLFGNFEHNGDFEHKSSKCYLLINCWLETSGVFQGCLYLKLSILQSICNATYIFLSAWLWENNTELSIKSWNGGPTTHFLPRQLLI